MPTPRHKQQVYRRRPPFMILFVAITLLGTSIWDLNVALTSKSSLEPLAGTFQVAKTNVIRTHETGRHGFRYVHNVLELKFKLKEHDKLFILNENIGDGSDHSEYGDIIRELQSSKTVTVWIRKDEDNIREPIVFQLDTDQYPGLVKLERIKFRSGPFAILMALLGIGFLLAFLAATFPKQVQRLLFGSSS